jgi:4a-hydroxytetrahydrobiopterin dehydratase
MKAYSVTEVEKILSESLKNWSFDGIHLTRSFKFSDFVKAFSFMTSVALNAEKMDHHPEWTNIYNTVNIKLNTHDAKGITQLDIDLATTIDKLSGIYD